MAFGRRQRFDLVDHRVGFKELERANGIEPSSLAWEAKVITIIRRPHCTSTESA